MPQITVIVPVYKVEAFLQRCIDSILGQTFQDFELVLVDDGSPDKSGEICDNYAAKNEHIFVIHQPNGGLSAARNAGIDWAFQNSTSHWLTFIDSDDWIHSQYLQNLFDTANSHGTAICVSNYLMTSGRVEEELELNQVEREIFSAETYWCTYGPNAIIACAKLYKKELFLGVRYPVGKLHEDEFTTYKLLFKAGRISVVEAPLYYYYQNPDSIMRSGWSLKHLAEVDGKNEQLAFFIDRKYAEASSFTARMYLSSIFRNASYARDGGKQYQTEHRALVKRLRLELKRFAPLAGMNLENANWLYYMAHPVMTFPHRVLRRLLKKQKD